MTVCSVSTFWTKTFFFFFFKKIYPFLNAFEPCMHVLLKPPHLTPKLRQTEREAQKYSSKNNKREKAQSVG